MKTAKKARIDDVARLAGVSIATVSRAMSNPDRVRPETLQTVHEAVKKLGYVAHGNARALASKKSRTIGAVIPSLENAIFANTTFALQKVLGEGGYMLVVACNEYDPKTEVNLVRGLIGRGVDALVLVGVLHEPELYALLERFEIPHVFTWAYDESGMLPVVGFNHRGATSQITRHLLELGHQEFGIISTITRNNRNAQDRLAGVIDTLESAGIQVPQERIVEEPFSFIKGGEGFRHISSGARMPTAVICLNDVLAIGALAEARAMGLKVPEEISITGCEDLEVAAMVHPALTTVRYPTWEMGHYAGTNLLAQLQNEKPLRQRIFPTKLIVRESSAAPPKSAP